MGDYEFTISLRMRHPDIDPARITSALGLQPQHSWRAGEVRRDSEGDPLTGNYRESYWMCGLMPDPKVATENIGVESELMQVLSSLHNSLDFLKSLNTSGGAVEVHVSVFAREAFRLELLAGMVSMLGQVGLGLIIEVQPHPAALPAAAPH
jgi:hypothetical protein